MFDFERTSNSIESMPDDAPYILIWFQEEEMHWVVNGAKQNQIAMAAVKLISAANKE